MYIGILYIIYQANNKNGEGGRSYNYRIIKPLGWEGFSSQVAVPMSLRDNTQHVCPVSVNFCIAHVVCKIFCPFSTDPSQPVL